MRDEDYTPKLGRPKLGAFVYSSSDCGEDSAIRISFLEWCEKIDSYTFSPDQAEKLANLILEVVDMYRHGRVTI